MIRNCFPYATGSVRGALAPVFVAAFAAFAPAAFAQQSNVSAGAGQAAETPATVPAGQAAIDPETAVVATIDGEPIYLAEIFALIRQLPDQYQQAPLEQIYTPMLDRAIDSRLIASAARKAGLQDREDVKERLARAEDEVISEVFLTDVVSTRMTDDVLRARYDATVAGPASQDEEVSARHILVASEEEALAIIGELKTGADFAELAKAKSTGPSGSNGGDLGYFTREAMVEPFANAAFAMEPGSFSLEPVQTQFGWHVIRVEDRRAVAPPSFEQMRPQLAQDVSREILGEAVEELRGGVTIERFAPDGSVLP